ncbi:MAG: ferric reductase-like transmembrane domain-containing protein [Sedimentitalea sp.]
MRATQARPARTALVWAGLALAVLGPVVLAATSPLLAWREPIYIAAGFAGIIAMALLLIQPLLAGGALPGVNAVQSRRAHRAVGGGLLVAVVVHVAALWLTSPPDVIDALTFSSPTPFSAWGVVAMWAVFAAALMAALRRRIKLRPRLWQHAHKSLAVVIVLTSVVHAVLIEGTMEVMSKFALCALVITATASVVWHRRTPTKPAL